MTRRRLPLGIQTFRTIREDDCYYVDKTAYARRLIDGVGGGAMRADRTGDTGMTGRVGGGAGPQAGTMRADRERRTSPPGAGDR